MCLAIPAKIVNIEDGMGTVDMAGLQKKVIVVLNRYLSEESDTTLI